MSQENVEIVRSMHDAFLAGVQRGEFAGARDSGFIGDEFEFFPAAELEGESIYHGVDGFVEFMRNWTEDFEDWSMRLDRLIDAPMTA